MAEISSATKRVVADERAEDHLAAVIEAEVASGVAAASEAATPAVASVEETPVSVAAANPVVLVVMTLEKIVVLVVVVALEAEALVLVLEVETLAEASAEEAVAAEKIVIACSSVASHGKAPKMMLDRTFKMFSQMPQISVYHQTEMIQTK